MLLYSGGITTAIVNAAVMSGRDPTYAFQQNSRLPLQKYFNATEDMPNGSIVNITLPYMDVSLRYIDADSINSSHNGGNTTYSEVTDGFGARQVRLVPIVRDTQWEGGAATPQAPSVFVGTKIIAVKLAIINSGDKWPDGTVVNETTACPTVSSDFGSLTAVNSTKVRLLTVIELG
jgi:hypothetical protein